MPKQQKRKPPAVDINKNPLKRLSENGKKVQGKRKGQASPDSDSEIEDSIPLANTFDALSEIDGDMEISSRTVPSAVEKRVKVPPIVVTSVTDLASFRMQLSNHEDTRGLKVSFQVGRRGECRVLTESLQDHTTFCGYLKNHLHKFYTFDTKSAKPFKVVMKGLSSEQSTDEIKNELQVLLGFAPSQVILMKKKSNANSRFGLSQQNYLIHFNRNEVNNLKIFDKVQFLFHVRVKWEHYRKHGGNGQNITQCRRCQLFGHGTDHCNMEPKCMICGNLFHTKGECPVKESAAFKCANCGENHKSNFWDCPIRKRVLESRAKHQPKGKKLSSTQALTIPVSQPQIASRSIMIPNQQSARMSYSSIVAGTKNSNAASSNNCTNVIKPQVPKISKTNCSVNNASNFELGDVTPENLQFLQNSLFDLIQKMSQAKSMFEAIQTGLEFANNIVYTLKFRNGSK